MRDFRKVIQMDAWKLNYFKERLIQEKKQLEEKLANSDQYNLNESQTEATGELSSYDNHPADQGSETFEREKDLGLRNNAHELYLKVNDALEHVEKGDFGLCESCGREIGEERIEAIPYSTFCIACQREEEDLYINNRDRPIEEEVLGPPFGRTFLDKSSNVGIDGEDIWQSVARYGTSETPSDLGGENSYGDMFYDAHEPQGIVERIDGIIDTGPDEIPPDPGFHKQIN
jgi:YteA family regulatory protein